MQTTEMLNNVSPKFLYQSILKSVKTQVTSKGAHLKRPTGKRELHAVKTEQII